MTRLKISQSIFRSKRPQFKERIATQQQSQLNMGKKLGIIAYELEMIHSIIGIGSGLSNKQISSRVLNEEDIVPHLPDQQIGFIYVGQEVWCQKELKNKQICSPLKGQDPSSSFQSFSVEFHMNYSSLLASGC